ncbi:MAG: hypothetical protein K9I69_05220 [Ignavibacteriales bacterium]|nr:hypothetical protein [Ignavibacteriales bacterium]MCF8307091.1 hypothetical protein [Ignavibacteriales bacterium]MCF8316753.1 hypothetical protein [Ignavibacteriales bacterium]MCF8436013.1 hypothetical protein [Ignavibacteriales bacterium]
MAHNKLLVPLFLVLIISLNAQQKTMVYVTNTASISEKAEIFSSRLLTELNISFSENRRPHLLPEYADPDVIKAINELWTTAKFKCIETEIFTEIIDDPVYGYEIRGIPLLVQAANDSVAFEEGVIAFDKRGIIQGFYFGIPLHQYKNLLRFGTDETDLNNRLKIIDFVDIFRTAYNRKDSLLLKNVFSENALIIVGRVTKISEKTDDLIGRTFSKEKVELFRMSKKEYLSSLFEVFRRNRYIKVEFEDLRIIRHRLFPNVYGVNLRQKWMSSGYQDKGYLFLMVDFRDENKPTIHVRAWQPEKSTNPGDVISLGDFELIE